MSLFTASKIEIEFSGSFTDVTAYHTVEFSPLVVKGGRPTEFDTIGPGSVTLDLINTDGRFSPDNTSGAYTPNVIEGKRLRVSLVKGGVTYTLFTGYIQAWEPSFPDNDVNNAITTVTALDSLSILAQRTMLGQGTEAQLALAAANSTWCDAFTFRQVGSTTALSVLTNSPAATISSGAIQSAGVTGVNGSVTWGTDNALAHDGVANMNPVSYQTGSVNIAKVGEFIIITPRSGMKAIEFCFNVETNQIGTDYFIGTDEYFFFPNIAILGTGNPNTASNNKRRFDMDGVGTDYRVQINSSDYISPAAANIGLQNVGQWQKICFVANGSSIDVYLNDTLSTTASVNINTITTISLGYTWNYDGVAGSPFSGTFYSSNGAEVKLSGLALYGAALRTTLANSLSTGAVTIATALTQLTSQLSGYSFTFTTVGSDSSRAAVNGYTNGISGLAALQQVMAGNNGQVWARTDGTVLLMHPDSLYPQASLVTFGSESEGTDRTAAIGLKRASESRPTRVAVTSAATSVTAVDTVSEAATSVRRDLGITTTNANPTDALTVGWALMSVANAMRVATLSVDLVSASTDLTATLLSTSGTTGALFPTQRVTVNVPSSIFGVSSKDVYLQGWTITIGEDYAYAEFDCSPATKATVTGGTCVGSTSTGTVIITSDRPWTTVAQAYPMDLDWAGERIRVNAPGGATSPQTFTVTNRGVTGGAAASSHLSGTSIDVWHAAGA